jgi:hypothetical protein
MDFKVMVSFGASSCFAAMSNQELMQRGNATMDETDKAIDRGRRVSCCCINLSVKVHLQWSD